MRIRNGASGFDAEHLKALCLLFTRGFRELSWGRIKGEVRERTKLGVAFCLSVMYSEGKVFLQISVFGGYPSTEWGSGDARL